MSENCNPCVVEVVRGPRVESWHRGALAVSDGGGVLHLALGDVERAVYPRSAVKALQALALVESGAADALALSDDEVALACASHNGEPRHVEAVRAMLAKPGLDESALECGPHPPRRAADLAELHLAGALPGSVHNNCSGKHAGMLATACHMGAPFAGYSRVGHPVQQAVRRAIAEICEAPLDQDACAIDGCSVPTWALALRALARGFARFASGEGLPPDRARACARIRRAVADHPFMVAGTGRFCTALMEAAGPAAFVKSGAEGVFCAAFPERGLGVALKIDDGAGRAAEVLIAELVLALCQLKGSARQTIQRLARPILTNWAGIEVGEVRVAGEASSAIARLAR